MKINTSNKMFSRTIIVVLAVVLSVGSWLLINQSTNPMMTSGFDMPIYSSLETLESASDVIVMGKVSGITGREIDYGSADLVPKDGNRGVPVIFYSVEVSDTLKGNSAKSIIVCMPDTGSTTSESVTGLKTDEKLLLFLVEQNPENAPGIKSYDQFYVTVSLDNGVFDVIDDQVFPRMPEAFFTADIVECDSSWFSMQDIENVIPE